MPDAERKVEGDAAERVSFYVSAHEDDWQLFMNPSAFRDVLDGIKSVFIHVTAGDAGLGLKTGGGWRPYYLARENGAEAAIRFMADADDRAPIEPVVSMPVRNGRALRRIGYRQTVAYFLRLPDGSPSGEGYDETARQSLKRLKEGAVDTLTAIDGTASYGDWSDVVATLRDLIEAERGHARAIDIHVPELDPALNPDDHADHVMSAMATLAAVEGLSGVRLMHHLGYNCGAKPENLSGHERDMKCAVYAVTLASLTAFGHPTSWQHYDQSFVARNYFRLEDRTALAGAPPASA